jgi:general secretion pathway protein A
VASYSLPETCSDEVAVLYEKFWGLREKPFENSPDPKYLFPSAEHKQAIEMLMYAVRSRKGGALLTGDYGCGKTLLIRVLVQELARDGVQTAVVNYPKLSGIELLRDVLYQLGNDVRSNSRLKLTRAVGEILQENVRAGKHTMIVVDEAQVIERKSILEELRLLLNYQLNDRFLLTLLLVGQPELREIVASLPQLEQRLTVRTHLHTFDLVDTAKYISYRLGVAGASRPVFSQDAVEAMYTHSYGCPRRVNNLGDLSLWKGFQDKVSEVGADIVEAVA